MRMKSLVFGGVLGLLTGCAVGYFITKKMVTDKKEQEIRDVVSTFEDKCKRCLYNPDMSKLQHIKDYINATEEDEKEKYRDIVIEHDDDEKDYDQLDEDDAAIIITEEQYGLVPEYDENDVIFYAKDEVVADEFGFELSDELGEIGKDWRDVINDTTKPIYIRNDVKQAYYRILKTDEYFDETDFD